MPVFKKKEQFRKENLEYSPSIKSQENDKESFTLNRYKEKELTGSVPLERTTPSLNRNLDKEFSLQVSSPCQKERDIFPHIP